MVLEVSRSFILILYLDNFVYKQIKAVDKDLDQGISWGLLKDKYHSNMEN